VAKREPELNERQKKFVMEYLRNGGNGTEAAIAAGYSPKSAAVQASRMLNDDKVLAYKRAQARQIYYNLGLTDEQIALDLREIYNRCMTATPHLSWDSDQHAYLPDGTWQFDSRGAIKALGMLLQMSGRLEPKRVQVEIQAKTTIADKENRLKELIDEIGRGDD
jgi:Phage terminase, small subunit